MYTVKNLIDQLRAGECTFPGGYPCYFLTADQNALSFDSVRENLLQCARSTRDYSKNKRWSDKSWAIVGADVNWEDDTLTCSHSGEAIESAYGSED